MIGVRNAAAGGTTATSCRARQAEISGRESCAPVGECQCGKRYAIDGDPSSSDADAECPDQRPGRADIRVAGNVLRRSPGDRGGVSEWRD